MRKTALWVGLSILTISVLSACAPSIKGGSQFDPFVSLGEFLTEPIPVTAGSNWYVQVPMSSTLLTRDQRKSALPTLPYEQIQTGATQQTTGNWLVLTREKVPTNWEVNISVQNLKNTYDEVKESGGSKEWYNNYSLNIVFAIFIPQSTPAGKYSVLLAVGPSGSKSPEPVGFSFDVQEKKETK